MSGILPTSSAPLGLLESSWLHFCGTHLAYNADDAPTKFLYWELFADAALVMAPAAMAPLLLQPLGFVEFSLIYFSLVNGWLIYVHHFKSRFQEQSRMHAVLQWIFILSMICGVWNCSLLARHSELTEMELTIRYQQFSVSMGFLRLTMFIMFARVAVHVWRAASFCMLVTFFLGNSFLCFTLAAISDRKSIVILWTISAGIESMMDLFLALVLSQSLHVSVDMPLTMDRFWSIVLAPLGSIIVSAFLYNQSAEEDDITGLLFRISAVLLLALFGLLYFNLKEAVSNRLRRCHRFLQTLGLLHMKLFGLALWTVGANLWILITLLANSDVKVKEIRHHSDLLALSVIFALILLFAWKSCNGRPYELGEMLWIFLINGAFACGTILSPTSSHLCLLTLDVVLLAVLNLVESCPPDRESGQRRNGWMEFITSTMVTVATASENGQDINSSPELQRLLMPHSTEGATRRGEYSSVSTARVQNNA
jgi:hypothetical protein